MTFLYIFNNKKMWQVYIGISILVIPDHMTVNINIKEKRYILLKNALPDKMSSFSTRWPSRPSLGFVMIFECQYSYFYPLPDLFVTFNHPISISNEGIRRRIKLSTTFVSTHSWGSVHAELHFFAHTCCLNQSHS